jgi:hypothetical protein
MTLDVPRQFYRGVLCMSCRQPIPLPPIVSSLEGSSKDSETGQRAFSLRCRACGWETPYRSAEIVEVEGAPRTPPQYLRHLEGARRQQGSLSRAANG